MKLLKWSIVGSLSLIFLLLVCLAAVLFWPGKASETPLITFHYNKNIDCYLCSSENRVKIIPSWHTELKTKIPILEHEWNQSGPQLLAQTSKLIGKPFPYSKYDISIFLCPNLPGTGLPLMIPVRMYLKNAVVEKPWNKSEFSDMVYHELLHIYVFRALHWNLWTPLLNKYHHENLNTKIHLHLFALQKAVYTQLGLENHWQSVVTRSKEFSPSYSRAIEIVEKEGYEPFINELKR